MDTPLTQLVKRKREKIEITNIRNESRAITIPPMDVWAIKEYNEQTCAYKFDNLDEMGQFLEDAGLFFWNFSTKTHTKRIYNLYRFFSIKENKWITNNLLKLKALGPDGFTDDFQQTFKEEIVLIPLESFPEKRSTGSTS